MKFLVCAKAATDLVNIVPYMFKRIMNKRWIYSACNNVLSPHFKVEREQKTLEQKQCPQEVSCSIIQQDREEF